MASYNKVILLGNLTRDPELKQIPSGQSVANIGIAVNRRFKTKDGEDREETTFVDCEAWGRQAEVIAQYFQKGKPIFIDGRLKLDTWDDKDGKKQSKLRVVVEDFQFVGGRDGGGGAGEGGGGHRQREDYAPSGAQQGRANRASGGHTSVPEEDIPF